jgi:hypothetical protein
MIRVDSAITRNHEGRNLGSMGNRVQRTENSMVRHRIS